MNAMMQRGGRGGGGGGGIPDLVSKDAKAAATKLFDRFYHADEFQETVDAFDRILDVLGIRSGSINQFYPIVRQSILHNSAQSLFRLIDEKRRNPVYKDGTATAGISTLIVGCGPCGLRTAIEAQLMGSKVVMLEKRNSFTRNNVLHIWPFVIEDLKALGCKVFFPKFCTGAMNHISIRRLQAVLVKTALLLGVEVHLGVTFSSLEEPGVGPDAPGWRVRTVPDCPAITGMDLDVMVGAEGKRVTVPGFPRKEFRGKLAIAITANFVNNNTTAEAVVEEISGVAFVYKQDFFNALYDELGIALENIVYYKDETHYFVMTTKKHSLLARDVLKKDYKDPIELLRQENINKSALMDYIRDTCDYCTDYQLPNLRFALNHHDEPDVALFDFTSMFAARNSLHVKERRGRQLLSCLVGDGLLEPFWPTGTGCARGFLGAFDACWAMRNWATGEKSILQVIAEREAIYKMLAQTTPENIGKEFKRYSIDPSTRYTHIDYRLMLPQKVMNLYDSDCAEHGWQPPIADNRRLELMMAQQKPMVPRAGFGSGSGSGNLNRRSDVQSDLMYLDARTREISRHLEELEPKRMRENSSDAGGGGSGGGGAGHNLRQGLGSLVSPHNKPSIMDKRAPRTAEQPAVGKLSDAKKAVLIAREEAAVARKVAGSGGSDPVGKLSNEQMAVLMAGGGGGERASRKTSDPSSSVGRLTQEQMSVLSLRPDDGEAAAERRRIRQEEVRRERERDEQEAEMRRRRAKRATAMAAATASKPTRPDDLDIVDMELDDMLVQLETDEDFQRLSDNEKMAWLESLFYLDTGNANNNRRNLNHVPSSPNKENRNLKINNSQQPPSLRPAGARKSSSPPLSTPTPTTKNVKPSQVACKTAAESVTASGQTGVNENLISLAQSFFANDPKKGNSSSNSSSNIRPVQPVKPQQRPAGPKPFAAPSSPQPPVTTTDSSSSPSIPILPKRRPSLEASLGISSTKLSPPSPVPERAFFEPASPAGSMLREDSPEFPPPPIPPRSDKNKTAMLRLMARTTDILKN